jgi:FMN phosphatase YigB (HAD superfamily)
MVGDTSEADYHGPKRFSMHELYLNRNGESPELQAIQSLAQLPPLLETL